MNTTGTIIGSILAGGGMALAATLAAKDVWNYFPYVVAGIFITVLGITILCMSSEVKAR